MKLIINCETGVESYEEETAEDIAQLAIDEIYVATPKVRTDPLELARLAAKASAQTKLAALGLTADEVAAIVGN